MARIAKKNLITKYKKGDWVQIGNRKSLEKRFIEHKWYIIKNILFQENAEPLYILVDEMGHNSFLSETRLVQNEDKN